MSGYTLIPASTLLTETRDGPPRSGGIGFRIVDEQLSFAIADAKGNVMLATLHADVLDEFCGRLADHIAEVSPEAANAQLEAASWPTMQ